MYTYTMMEKKRAVTILITANAAYTVTPSMVINKSTRIPASISEVMSYYWGTEKSKCGMTSELFYEYMCNVFHP
jgi:hypothetical protein